MDGESIPYIFFIKIWYSSLKSSKCLDSKRRLVYADKTIDLFSSHGVHYLVHYSALCRSLVVNFEV